MSCTSCKSQCSCNGTIKSRRCECVPTAQRGLAIRDTTVCGDNGLFNPAYFANNHLDTTEVYGSGLSKPMLEQLRNFDLNTQRYRSATDGTSIPGFLLY